MFDVTAADRGIKLLPKKASTLHPRAQVQSLKRIATRALGQADRIRQYEGDVVKAQALEAKANDALAAMIKLNADHGLGYPIH